MTEKIKLKPRYAGHEVFNSVLRDDWKKTIERSPDSFQAYLYRPVDAVTGALVDDYEEEAVQEVDTHQNTHTYADPLLVYVLDCPDQTTEFNTMDDGGENTGESIEPLLLRVNETVPNGSVLEWDEETKEGIKTVYWYVLRGVGYGTANIGILHVCIPMRDFDSLPEFAKDNQESEYSLDEMEEENQDNGISISLNDEIIIL